jgi:hypothetical protein
MFPSTGPLVRHPSLSGCFVELTFSTMRLALWPSSQLGIIWCPMRPDLYDSSLVSESHCLSHPIINTLIGRCVQLQLPKR